MDTNSRSRYVSTRDGTLAWGDHVLGLIATVDVGRW